MHQRRLTAGLGLLLVTALGAGAWSGQASAVATDAVAKPAADPLTFQLPATINGNPGSVSTTLTEFVLRDDRLAASLDVAGQPVDVLVTGMAAEDPCKVLDLTLGPIDISRSDLHVDLDALRLQLLAEPGKFDPTKLLGDMLCQMAKLFEDGRPKPVVEPLNRVSRLLDIRLVA